MTIDQKSIAMTAQPNQHIALNAMTEMDLTPLAWVFEELKKAIQSSTQSVKCFANEQHGNIEFDNKSAPIDFSHLHTAAQHLKQATGVLTVIQMPEVAKMTHSMACMVQQYMAQPATCIAHTLNRFEMAGFAALDYLNAVLQQQSIHPISLFPAYKCLCEALGQKMVHPADLCFSHERRLQSLANAWALQTQPTQSQTAFMAEA
jgi:hypothetical protein